MSTLRTLGIALTSRDKGDDPVPMAGFPYHQLDPYLAKIIAAGHRAAICEQVEDPKQAKGIVRREVTRIVTTGTLMVIGPRPRIWCSGGTGLLSQGLAGP